MRQFFLWLHRWGGLAMTVFLVIVGLTGSVLAFRSELDRWLNPKLLTVAKRDAPMLDPFTLRERAQALYPDQQFDWVSLKPEPDRAVSFSIATKSGDGAVMQEILFDPYTGEKLGQRTVGEISLAKESIIAFVYRLHYTLAFPGAQAEWGMYVLGVVALAWTIDCFVSFYLTFPLKRREGGRGSGKSRLSRWKPAWLIKCSAGAYRIVFDVHRAFGLWTWVMLFVFAWSSVYFNLNAVYKPTMETLFGKLDTQPELPARAAPLGHPRLSWREARDVGAALLEAHAQTHGYRVLQHEWLSLDREHGVYTFSARSSLDRVLGAETSASFDADTGELKSISWPDDSNTSTSATITYWLAFLHMARIFGLPMKIFVCAMGLVITALSVTGVYIWWKKRAARKIRVAAVERSPAREAVAP